MTQPLLGADISIFRGSTNTTPVEQIPLTAILDRIQNGTYQQYVAHLRQLLAGQGKGAYDTAKKQSMAFTPAGVFARRANAKLTAASGLVHFDFDHPATLADAKARLIDDPYVAYAFISPSGDGLKVAVWADGITDDPTYKHAWQAVLTYFERCYPDLAVANDKACKDIARLCYISHDPALYRNPTSVPFVVPPYVPPPPRQVPAHRFSDTPDYDRVASALVHIPTDNYDDWLKVGMAMHSTGESWAYDLWNHWSQSSEKYAEREQETTWRSFKHDGAVTLGSLFHLAQQHGYAPPRREGPRMESQTYQHRRNGTGAVAEETPDDDDTRVDTRPRIDIGPDITHMVDQGQAALMGLPGGPLVFQRARQVCLIARGVKPPKWMHRPLDTPVIVEASQRYLEELATQAAMWAKYDAREKAWKEAVPPPRFVETLLGRPGWPFPVLEGIIQSPTLRPDGSIIDTPGYDVDTGLYLDSNGTTFPPLLAHPTYDDARSAIGRLQEAVQNFPFTKDAQEQDGPGFSATLAAIMTLVCRFAIAGNVPLFAIRATTRGSGKSLLVDVMSILGTGRAAPRWPQVTEEDEERKRLLTVALAGYQAVHVDNVTRPLGSPALDMALTSSTISDRILGQNASKEVPNVLVWFASGNNMMFRGDTARRVVPIDLDPKMERPEERTGFVHDPLLPWIVKERPRLVVAALTILKAYFDAGMPAQALPQFGSFEQWSRLIRHALVWAGEQDPCAGRQTLEAESDPEYEHLATLLDTWHACYQGAPRRLQAAIDDIHHHAQHLGPDTTRNAWNDLQDALGACDGRYDGKTLSSERLGYAFRKWEQRTVAGKRFVNATKGSRKPAAWYAQAI